jgi:hypothetical protein
VRLEATGKGQNKNMSIRTQHFQLSPLHKAPQINHMDLSEALGSYPALSALNPVDSALRSFESA